VSLVVNSEGAPAEAETVTAAKINLEDKDKEEAMPGTRAATVAVVAAVVEDMEEAVVLVETSNSNSKASKAESSRN
jgi:hypothetical protein